jgi:hypothetical protein
MEKELTGVDMAPVGLPLATDNVLHMMVTSYIMMTFQIVGMSLMAWENMKHTLHVAVVLFLVIMVIPMT